MQEREVRARIIEAANAQFVHWLFGPKGRHIRDYAAISMRVKHKGGSHGKTGDLPAA